MTTLSTRSFTTMVQTFAAGVQGRANTLIDFSVGSPLRAIAESFSGAMLWLQAMILQVLTAARLSTSTGSDVDSFVADFSQTRLGAQAATGLATFSRFTASASAPFVPVGATVKTSDGSQSFAVYADTTNTAYSAALGGYTMPAQVTTLVAPVAALVPGSAGNVQAGAISQMTTPISGIDTVSNPAAFTNGIDEESDAALKARFQAFIAGLRQGTNQAIIAAIQALQSGLQVVVHENVDVSGAADAGMLTIYVDDGSGNPPASLITNANAVLYGVRAAGIRAAVYPATTLLASVSMTITTATGYVHQNVVAQVVAALGAAINATGLEKTLSFYSLAAVAFGVAGVTNVSAVSLNADAVDLRCSFGQTIKAKTIAVV